LALATPLVAIGAPVGAYYPEVARRLGAELSIPEHASVCNAVGAVAGVVSQTVEVLVNQPSFNLFRVHDLKSFEKLAPMSGEEDNYVMAVRDAASTMERLLKADMDTLKPDAVDEAWDVTSLNQELREDAWSQDQEKR
jgi:N-methylhydantoinase A/oxoprolinase/acetone carboxylase beta subunit